ncbi:Serine kinase of the HPr protein, regulates carbohydrate metabolism [Labilithrix luteola]|uniref:Serine kinase of the HPr protein, regulates carbohydrate metabolism n=1 Tax=Labilithrix luteola TaxID=1391654 RepID=A0A0K1Q4Z6_9BACT|nr:Serine kinase of the HPr protein, regulates carbohydrate metabolism [Labilithrix luteola]
MRWLAEHVEDGEVAFRIGREGDDLVAEWVGIVRLTVGRDGRNVRFVPEPDAYEPDLEKIRRGSAALLLRQLEGKLALHGAAVSVDSRVLVLLGRSGQGKSTLAASLCQAGAALYADDAVAIESREGGYVVAPTEANHWLDRDARRALGLAALDDWKMPVATAVAGRTEVRLAVIVELVYAAVATPRLTRVTDVDAFGFLVPQVARFVLDEPERQRREFETLAHLIESVPIYRLERRRGFDGLPATCALLRDLVHRER